jgi:hypothetical protein
MTTWPARDQYGLRAWAITRRVGVLQQCRLRHQSRSSSSANCPRESSRATRASSRQVDHASGMSGARAVVKCTFLSLRWAPSSELRVGHEDAVLEPRWTWIGSARRAAVADRRLTAGRAERAANRDGRARWQAWAARRTIDRSVSARARIGSSYPSRKASGEGRPRPARCPGDDPDGRRPRPLIVQPSPSGILSPSRRSGLLRPAGSIQLATDNLRAQP